MMIETHTACAPKDRAALLAEAEAVCVAQGQKLTPLRQQVLELLLDAEAPAKAYDLLTQLKSEGSAKPPTIYRALDFLREMGLAHKIESLNAYVACGHLDHEHTAVFLICNGCGRAFELHAEKTAAALKEESVGAGFTVHRAVIEVQGRCRTCGSAKAKPAS